MYSRAAQLDAVPLGPSLLTGCPDALMLCTHGRYGTVEFSAGVVQLARVLAQEPRISVEAWHKERWGRGAGQRRGRYVCNAAHGGKDTSLRATEYSVADILRWRVQTTQVKTDGTGTSVFQIGTGP